MGFILKIIAAEACYNRQCFSVLTYLSTRELRFIKFVFLFLTSAIKLQIFLVMRGGFFFKMQQPLSEYVRPKPYAGFMELSDFQTGYT